MDENMSPEIMEDWIRSDAPRPLLRSGRTSMGWQPIAIFVPAMVALALIWMVAPVVRSSAPAASTPGSMRPVMVTFDQSRPYSAVAAYDDGTRVDIAVDAYGRLWQPDRPVRMVMVASADLCAIQIGDDVKDRQAAPVGQIAVCVWAAPPS